MDLIDFFQFFWNFFLWVQNEYYQYKILVWRRPLIFQKTANGTDTKIEKANFQSVLIALRFYGNYFQNRFQFMNVHVSTSVFLHIDFATISFSEVKRRQMSLINTWKNLNEEFLIDETLQWNE